MSGWLWSPQKWFSRPKKPLQPHWPHQPHQPYILQEIPDHDGLIVPGTKMTNTGPFLWNGSSKIQFFTDIWYSSWRDFWGQPMSFFFENWLIKHKCAILLKPLGTIIQEIYWSSYLSETFRIIRFNMRHPITTPYIKKLETYFALLYFWSVCWFVWSERAWSRLTAWGKDGAAAPTWIAW